MVGSSKMNDYVRDYTQLEKLLGLWLAVVLVYIIVSWMFVYRFRHPQLSETELFLSFWDAMCWR